MNKPNLSIIIATFNRCEDLNDTLASLAEQNLNDTLDYELIIIDNNSKDNTKKMIESYSPLFNGKLKYIFEPRQGKSFALNRGIKISSGEILIFLDDDVIFDKNWLRAIYGCFHDCECDGVGGRVLPLYPDKTPKWIKENRDLLRGPIASFDFGEEIKPFEKDAMYAFFGTNIAYRKTCFDKYGVFKADLGPGQRVPGEDTEFFRRIEASKNKLLYCGKALVWHKVDAKRMNYKYLAGWYFHAGKYTAMEEKQGATSQKFVYYFGIPRYLIKMTTMDFLSLLASIFNRTKFLKALKASFTNLGKCYQYRKLSLCQ